MLDERDKQRLAQSTQETILTGEDQTWSNPETGVTATTTVREETVAPPVATGLVREGWCDLIGFGRSAFAYPDAPNDILRGGGMVPGKCCVTCSMCSQIMKDGVGRGGCVVRDSAVYAPEYRRGRDAARQTMVARKL